MTHSNTQTRPDPTKSNPNAVSIRIEPKPMAKAKFQRRHDFRVGSQPNYVDEDRTHLNQSLMPLRPLPDIRRENEKLRMQAGRTRKMKSNAAVVTAGIITFGHSAQDVFNALPEELRDCAFSELATEIAVLLNTTLEALVVHLDETAIHAHFTLRAYNDDGEPISNATRLSDMSALQDLAAEVMQRYAPEIERGAKKKAPIASGANYTDTLHRTVKQLHEDLPQEKAVIEAQIEALSEDLNKASASVDKTQRHLEKLEFKVDLSEKEIKRKETYRKRLANKHQELAQDVARLELKQQELAAIIDREKSAIDAERQVAREDREQAAYELSHARHAKQTYEASVIAIEAVLTEAENETLSYNPDTGKTTMEDPSPPKQAPPNFRTKIVKLAKRMAFMESNLFARICWLDEQINRIRTFLKRVDIEPDIRNEAELIRQDITNPDLGL